VDLHSEEIRAGDLVTGFEVDGDVRWRLLEGLDDISISLDHTDQIADYEDRRPGFMPVTMAEKSA
jgi:3-isopropylmalate/(R)-2-methylmalate dehydratase small subunit